MKYLSLLFLVMLAACATTQAKPDYDYEKLCADLAKRQARSEEWKENCSAEKPEFDEGIRAEISNLSDDLVCQNALAHFRRRGGPIAEAIASQRHLNCRPTIEKKVIEMLPEMPVPQVCLAWYIRKDHPYAIPAVDAYVESKNLNCVEIVNGLLQAAASSPQRRSTLMSVTHRAGTTCHNSGSSILCY